MNLHYPTGWPRCVCGDYCLDGKATCGRVECSRAQTISEIECELDEFRSRRERPSDDENQP